MQRLFLIKRPKKYVDPILFDNFLKRYYKNENINIYNYDKPEERMDPWKESLACYEDFADEVIVVGENFKNEFTWSDIGKMLLKV